MLGDSLGVWFVVELNIATCHNPSLGLATKAKGLQGGDQEERRPEVKAKAL